MAEVLVIEVGVRRVDAGVDDGDADALPRHARLPQRRRPHVGRRSAALVGNRLVDEGAHDLEWGEPRDPWERCDTEHGDRRADECEEGRRAVPAQDASAGGLELGLPRVVVRHGQEREEGDLSSLQAGHEVAQPLVECCVSRHERGEVAAQLRRRVRRVGRTGGLPGKKGENRCNSNGRGTHQAVRASCCVQPLSRLLEREPARPDGAERDLEDLRKRGMLDHEQRQVGRAGDRILHTEEHDRLVDDHELERQVRNEARLLAGREEALDTPDEGGVVERGQLVDAPRDVLLRHVEPFDVLLRRGRVRRLREDEDLVLDPALELVEALVDRAPVAEHLDVFERVGLLLPGEIGRRQLGECCGRHRFGPRERLALELDEAPDRLLGGDGRVLDHVAGARGREALLRQAREHVVDALPRDAGETGDLGRGRGVTADEGDVRLRLVLRQAETDQILGDAALVHAAQRTTDRGVSKPGPVIVGYAGEKSVRSGSRSPRRTARSTSTQRRPRASASVRACSTTFCAASTPRTPDMPGSGLIRSR